MAAPCKNLPSFIRLFCSVVRSHNTHFPPRRKLFSPLTKRGSVKPKVFHSVVLSALGFTTNAAAEQSSAKIHENDKTFEPNDPRLRSTECLRNAAGLSVDSTSAVLSQTVYAITNIERQYVELVDVLIKLTEYQLQVIGHQKEIDRIGDIILETRHEINKVRQRKDDLYLLFSSVEKLADATAEVAFATGQEYASTACGERLASVQREVSRLTQQSQLADARLSTVQATAIQVLAKEEEKQKLAEEERKKQLKLLELEAELSEVETDSGKTGEKESKEGDKSEKEHLQDGGEEWASETENKEEWKDRQSGDSGWS